MRAVFKFSNEDYLNVEADQIDVRDKWICAWNGEDIVAIAKTEIVDACYLTEKKEDQNGKH